MTKAPKIKHETSRIRWSEQTAAEIARLARGIAHQVRHFITLNPTHPMHFAYSCLIG